ncbi:ABC1 kinase family protein [Desulfosporosinus lacus]|uniref:Predicted unusual protein kinase regulating ubiquinone biosynthesis, AarF/ABC1/UbiB family n=1 Tax=Desulfosporosinus lacus DSM 15449 TaxID=1121420 RepID=A0A1M6GSK1_9FIRM|nr:AarF/UbiB family protein [Desulfosporosinus lacus]SHJ12902.1 Predicted unusual protein kinase regulating ubiquinone biosynthesis, AarF/ABC1/UbiB family [Desulfosporosinus lacus DSM 15449]
MPIVIRFFKDKRLRRIISMFLQFVCQLWWINKKKRFLSNENYQKQIKEVYRKQASVFTETATELGGLLIKLGQFFSARVDVLPEEYTNELSKLQDAVKPVGTEEIIKRIEEEYGKPISEVFLNFSREAIASASLGQVHVAEIQGHNKVAVKVLRPGIEKIIQTDFNALRFMVTFAKRYPKIRAAVDLEQIYNEFVETTQDELDYIKEGQHADIFRANFSGDSRISVPEVYWEYTTQHVLVMEYVTGCKVNDYENLAGAGIDRAELADTLISAYVQQLLSDAFFHADPHPGNLLVKEDGTLIFLDFGMVGRIEKGMREELMAFILAVFKKDTDQMVTVFEKLGFLRSHADKQTLAKGLKLILANVFEDPNLRNVNSEELLLELREFMYSQPFQIPAQTLFLGKSLLTIMGICGGLNPQLDLIKTLRPYAEELLAGEGAGNSPTGFIIDQAKKTLTEVVTLPEKLNRLIAGLEGGEIRLHPSRSFESNLLQSQMDQTSRIVRAIMSSGFLISGAVLLEGSYFKVGLILIILAGLTFASFLKFNSGSSGRKRMVHGGRSRGESSGFQKPRFHP